MFAPNYKAESVQMLQVMVWTVVEACLDPEHDRFLTNREPVVSQFPMSLTTYHKTSFFVLLMLLLRISQTNLSYPE